MNKKGTMGKDARMNRKRQAFKLAPVKQEGKPVFNLAGFDDRIVDETPTLDLINHPPHYTAGGIEVIDFIEAKGLGYNLGNVVKYVSRSALKGNSLDDLRKAAWYLDREINKEAK